MEGHEKKIFTFEEARALLPEVRRITEEAFARVEALKGAARPGGGEVEPVTEVERIVNQWARAMLERGIDVKGLWLVDFDNGSGYYCWQYPEAALEYYHSYEDGFRGRIRIH